VSFNLNIVLPQVYAMDTILYQSPAPCFGGAAWALNSLDNEEKVILSNVGDGKTAREETLEKRRVERQHQK
jgi:TPP-dependent pyruvate/acetoin dehydrogenase alpha subunit